jgi:RNA polymerase sigma-70 factor (ECF subfamily)
MNSTSSFEALYTLHYARLKRFAREYVVVEADAENIVHDVFADLWERWGALSSHDHLLTYLLLSVKSRCIDLLRRRIVAQTAEEHLAQAYQRTLQLNLQSLTDFTPGFLDEQEIERRIHAALDTLPERCREIFVKTKLEGRKQQEVADELNITVKTVKAQITIAYQRLRVELKDLLPLLFFFYVCR